MIIELMGHQNVGKEFNSVFWGKCKCLELQISLT